MPVPAPRADRVVLAPTLQSPRPQDPSRMHAPCRCRAGASRMSGDVELGRRGERVRPRLAASTASAEAQPPGRHGRPRRGAASARAAHVTGAAALAALSSVAVTACGDLTLGTFSRCFLRGSEGMPCRPASALAACSPRRVRGPGATPRAFAGLRGRAHGPLAGVTRAALGLPVSALRPVVSRCPVRGV